MARLLVPSQYATIAAAITASSSDDTIIISAGTYTEFLDFSSKNNVKMRAAYGELVTIVGSPSGGICVDLDATTSIKFRDLNFRFPGTGTIDFFIGYNTTPSRSFQMVNCRFDWTTDGNIGGAGTAVVKAGLGNTNYPTLIKRCAFLGDLSNADSYDYVVWLSDTTAGEAIIESNVFREVWGDSGIVRVTSSTPGADKTVIKHNYMEQCRLDQYLIYVDTVHASAECVIYNNLGHECTHDVSKTDAFFISSSGTLSTAQISDNLLYPSYTAASFDPDTSGNLLSDPGLTIIAATVSDHLETREFVFWYSITTSSPLYQAGSGRVLTSYEERIAIDYNRFDFSQSSPSIGPHKYIDTSEGALFVKLVSIDLADGFSFNFGATYSLATERITLNSPFEIAEFFEILLWEASSSDKSYVQLWITEDAEIGFETLEGQNFSFTVSKISEYLLGQNATAVSYTVAGIAIPTFAYLEYLLDEDPVGELRAVDSNLADSAVMFGTGLPDDSWRQVYRFRILSSKEVLVPEDTEESLRRLLSLFYSGVEMRVYRNWMGNLSRFDADDPDDTMAAFGDGYSDIVPVEVQDISLLWGDNVLSRTEFLFEGVEIHD